jgi:two-component system, cell cycle response regulator DivK
MTRRTFESGMRESLAARHSPRILVVDDDFDARALYCECLLAAGYRVASAADGNEALRLALSEVPRLVVLDLNMPHLDGWETARLIRSYQPTHAIPIIALSGLHDAATVSRAMGAGCNRFVPKPCSPEELVRIIELTLPEEAPSQRGVL